MSVPAHTGAVGRFSPSTAELGAVGSGLPGLADGANGELELETVVLRAQGNARWPRSFLRPHDGLTGLCLRWHRPTVSEREGDKVPERSSSKGYMESVEWEWEGIIKGKERRGKEGWLERMGTAVTGWRTQPPATQRGNDSRTLHLIFRTSPLASAAGYCLASVILPAPSRHNTSQNTARWHHLQNVWRGKMQSDLFIYFFKRRKFLWRGKQKVYSFWENNELHWARGE